MQFLLHKSWTWNFLDWEKLFISVLSLRAEANTDILIFVIQLRMHLFYEKEVIKAIEENIAFKTQPSF